MDSFLAFLGVSLLVIVTPGPDTAVTIRNALVGGRAGGVCCALGVAVGQAIWACATSLGVVALLATSERLFLAVKYAGAVYLILLGAQALRAALRGDLPAAPVAGGRRARGLRPIAAFRQGLASDLGNPKMAVFFASLLPQFAPVGEASALFLLGAVFSAMTFGWLAAYAAVVAKAGALLRRTGVRRVVEGAAGAVLIALGLRIAAEQR